MAHPIESEIIKACDFKPRKKYADRQDYLRSILMAANKLSDDDFDNLSDDAAGWVDACVKVHNSRKEDDLPDFDEEFEDEDDGSENEAPDEEADDESETDDADPEDEDDSETEDEPEGDINEIIADEADENGDDEEDEPEEVKPTKKAKAKAEPAPKPEKKIIKKPKVERATHLGAEDEDVVLDKWGCMEGSKNSQALAMFERGATSKEVKDVLNATFYNILTKMTQKGHRVEKEGHLIKLTHANELNAPKAKKSKK